MPRTATATSTTSASSRRSGWRRRVAAAASAGVALVSIACGAAPDTSVSPSGPGTAAVDDPRPATGAPGGTVLDLAAPGTTGPPEPGDPEPAAAPTSTTTTAPTLPIGTVQLDLVDTSRPTVSRGSTVAPSRSLPTTVTYPTREAGPLPLVVFAHGFRLGPPGYQRLVATITAAGYVVAAPSFPLADEAVAGTRVDRGDLPNQPADLSFVIDGVLAEAARPGSPLAGRVDGARIGAVGHSDGADTVLDLAYTAGRADGRVVAVVALAPDAVVAAGSSVGAGTPLLLQHGDADTVVTYGESVSVFANVPARRWFLTLLGAGHLEPVTEATPWTQVLDDTVVTFLDRFVAGEPLDDAAITSAASAAPNARIDQAG